METEKVIPRDMNEQLIEWRIVPQEGAQGTLYQLQRKMPGIGDGMVRGYRWRTEGTFGTRMDALKYLHWITIGQFKDMPEGHAPTVAEVILYNTTKLGY
jgi:hypothetical protein